MYATYKKLKEDNLLEIDWYGKKQKSVHVLMTLKILPNKLAQLTSFTHHSCKYETTCRPLL